MYVYIYSWQTVKDYFLQHVLQCPSFMFVESLQHIEWQKATTVDWKRLRYSQKVLQYWGRSSHVAWPPLRRSDGGGDDDGDGVGASNAENGNGKRIEEKIWDDDGMLMKLDTIGRGRDGWTYLVAMICLNTFWCETSSHTRKHHHHSRNWRPGLPNYFSHRVRNEPAWNTTWEARSTAFLQDY